MTRMRPRRTVPRQAFVLFALGIVALGMSVSAQGRGGFSLPAPALAERPAGSHAIDGDPVDLATGLYLREDNDLIVPDTPPIRFTRTYRNGNPESRAFGIGTNHPYDVSLVGDATAYAWAALIAADGGRILFVRISSGSSIADAVYEHTATPTIFYKSRLRWTGQGWEIDLRDGSRYAFTACGPNTRCAMIGYRDSQGRALKIVRDAAGNLTRITTPSGRGIDLTYDAGNRITRARGEVGRVVLEIAYHYDDRGRLIKVSTGKVTKEYTYDDAHQMVTIKEPGIVITNTYDTGGRVIKQSIDDGRTFKFAYILNSQGRITQTDVTEPDGSLRRVVFNAQGYTLSDTYAVGTPAQVSIIYQREAGSSRTQAVTVACSSNSGPLKMTEQVGPREIEDRVITRLRQRCKHTP